jgi:hypothetical protein
VSYQEIGTVRERLWLLAHDDRRDLLPLLDPRALEIGLMAATLVDLLLAERIVIVGRQVRAAPNTRRRTAGRMLDPVTEGVLHAVTADTPGLMDVLRGARADIPTGEHHAYVRLYLRTNAALIAAGVVVEQRRRVRSSRYYLADPDGLAWNRSQISYRLIHRDRPGDPTTDSLCALIGALNLHTMIVFPYPPEETGPILHTIAQQIPARVGPHSPLAVIPRLADQVRTAVGDLATAVF